MPRGFPRLDIIGDNRRARLPRRRPRGLLRCGNRNASRTCIGVTNGEMGMAILTVIPGGRSAAQRFEALVRPHYAVLYRTAYRLTRSVHDAEDLVQEVCVRAYPRLDELAQLDNPRAWLTCVMQRMFIDSTRRYERAHVESLETTRQESLVSEAPGLAEQTDEAQKSRPLEHAWQRLRK